MSDKAREYKRSTIRRLDTLSGNRCAAPDCERSLIARDNNTIVSKICHIEAASSEGPRFNAAMTDDDRRHYSNLILLCDECHSIIDNKENEERYPVELLKEWKSAHEAKQIATLNSKVSLLRIAVDAIANIDMADVQEGKESNSMIYEIEHKINHNHIIRNKSLIDEYKIFYTKIATLYGELESQGSFKKENLLRNINKIYLKTKGKYVGNSDNPLTIIQNNSDNILEDIEEELMKSCESYRSIYDEDISFGISVVMVDAFMRCKILEDPNDH